MWIEILTKEWWITLYKILRPYSRLGPDNKSGKYRLGTHSDYNFNTDHTLGSINCMFCHEHAAFQESAFGRSTAGNDVVATIIISLFSPVFFVLSFSLSLHHQLWARKPFQLFLYFSLDEPWTYNRKVTIVHYFPRPDPSDPYEYIILNAHSNDYEQQVPIYFSYIKPSHIVI